MYVLIAENFDIMINSQRVYMVPVDSVNESKIVDIDVNSENTSGIMDATRSSEEFATNSKPGSHVELDDCIFLSKSLLVEVLVERPTILEKASLQLIDTSRDFSTEKTYADITIFTNCKLSVDEYFQTEEN